MKMLKNSLYSEFNVNYQIQLKLLIISVITTLFLLMIIIPIGKGDIEYIKTVAIADSYVNSHWSDTNYGDDDWFFVGKSYGKEESFFYFDFSDVPSDWTGASFFVKIYSCEVELEISLCIAEGNWAENEITWDNKPGHGQKIVTFLSTESKDDYEIDVTSFLKGKSSITLCLYCENLPDEGHCQGVSREYAWQPFWNDAAAPSIIWEYNPDKQLVFISGYNSWILIGLVIGISMVFLKKKFKIKKIKIK